jgi:hypothetical protein
MSDSISDVTMEIDLVSSEEIKDVSIETDNSEDISSESSVSESVSDNMIVQNNFLNDRTYAHGVPVRDNTECYNFKWVKQYIDCFPLELSEEDKLPDFVQMRPLEECNYDRILDVDYINFPFELKYLKKLIGGSFTISDSIFGVKKFNTEKMMILSKRESQTVFVLKNFTMNYQMSKKGFIRDMRGSGITVMESDHDYLFVNRAFPVPSDDASRFLISNGFHLGLFRSYGMKMSIDSAIELYDPFIYRDKDLGKYSYEYETFIGLGHSWTHHSGNDPCFIKLVRSSLVPPGYKIIYRELCNGILGNLQAVLGGSILIKNETEEVHTWKNMEIYSSFYHWLKFCTKFEWGPALKGSQFKFRYDMLCKIVDILKSEDIQLGGIRFETRIRLGKSSIQTIMPKYTTIYKCFVDHNLLGVFNMVSVPKQIYLNNIYAWMSVLFSLKVPRSATFVTVNDQEALYMAYNAFGWRTGRIERFLYGQMDKLAPWKTIYLALMCNRGMHYVSYANNDTLLSEDDSSFLTEFENTEVNEILKHVSFREIGRKKKSSESRVFGFTFRKKHGSPSPKPANNERVTEVAKWIVRNKINWRADLTLDVPIPSSGDMFP